MRELFLVDRDVSVSRLNDSVACLTVVDCAQDGFVSLLYPVLSHEIVSGFSLK
jgi:hypothetical protein